MAEPDLNLLLRSLSWLNKKIDLPTNAKVFVESVVDKKKTPITSKDFSAEELDIVRDLIVASTKPHDLGNPLELGKPFGILQPTPGYVDYSTYYKPLATEPQLFGKPANPTPGVGPAAIFDRKSRVGTTLGQFRYSVNPEGDIDVTDKYDFKIIKEFLPTKEGGFGPLMRALSAAGSFGYTPIRRYAQEQLPEGTGRDVRITIPKEKFTADEYEDMLSALSPQL